jgi:hypothetical protein
MSKLTAITVEPVEYLYRPMYRDAYVSAFPSDVKWDYVEAPAGDPMIAVRRGLPLSRHQFGIIATNRRLTSAEREEFQMQIV